MTSKLPLTAITASRNEAALLADCLDSLSFCDELIVVDFRSSDDTVQLAAERGAKLISQWPIPTIFEQLHAEIAREAKNDWLLFIDPDERVDPSLAALIRERFKGFTRDPKLAAIYVPWRFYFRGRPLKGTVWGGANEKRLIMHRDRVDYTGGVHRGTIPKDDYQATHLKQNGDNVVHHLWMRGYPDWFEKHRRYLTLEGKNRYERGERVGRKGVILSFPRAFADSFFRKRGYRDGPRGLLLSLFWAWYSLQGLRALIKEQRLHA